MHLLLKNSLVVFAAIFLGYVTFMALPSCAANTQDFAVTEAKDALEKTRTLLPESWGASNAVSSAPQATEPQGPLLFVSLGMPDSLLQSLLEQAKALQVTVVIRGLYHDSFDATLKRLTELFPKDEADKFQGIAINPLWFKTYHIDAVPAVVVPHTQDNDFDVIFGNLTLSDALENVQHHHQGEAA